MRTPLAAMLVAGLCGCAGGWYRPNTTEAQFYQDRAACDGQSAAAYPVNMVTTGGSQGPANTRCTTNYGVTNCQTTPGFVMPGYTSDMNATGRASMFSACMRGKGYEFKLK